MYVNVDCLLITVKQVFYVNGLLIAVKQVFCMSHSKCMFIGTARISLSPMCQKHNAALSVCVLFCCLKKTPQNKQKRTLMMDEHKDAKHALSYHPYSYHAADLLAWTIISILVLKTIRCHTRKGFWCFVEERSEINGKSE